MQLGHSWGIFAHIKTETVDLQRSQMCGKQDLKSETAVNSVHFCIIWFNFEANLHKNSKYHAL